VQIGFPSRRIHLISLIVGYYAISVIEIVSYENEEEVVAVVGQK
jgi:hypothetical protein